MIAAASFTTASAPWWFVAALVGVLSVLGTATGAFISFWSLRASDRRRAKAEKAAFERQRAVDRDDKLRQAGALLLVASRSFVAIYKSNFAEVREPNQPRRFEPRNDVIANDLTLVYEPLWSFVFLASPEQGEASQKLLDSVRVFAVRAPGEHGPRWMTSTQYAKAYDRYTAARRTFVATLTPGED
jgi:hypothetical protein